MDRESSPPSTREYPRFGGFTPTEAAEEDLRWYFNEAAIDVDVPSNFCVLVSSVSPASLAAMQRRAEATHARGTISGRLGKLRPRHLSTLGDLYTERLWPERIERMFGELAGPITGSAAVWDEYERDERRFHTGAGSVEEWIELLLAEGCGGRIEAWRRLAEHRCAAAIAAYERVRGGGSSVVPDGCARGKEEA